MCRLGRAACLGAFLLALGGCGDKGKDDKNAGGAQILSFTSSMEAIVEGESATLQWETQGASAIILTANGVRIDGGDLEAAGSLEVRPEGDTTYGLEAASSKGASAKAEVFVEVLPFGPPQIDSFAATPSETKIGETVLLNWSVRGADSIELAERGGQSLATEVDAEGSLAVEPSRSTTYVLRASNAHGVSTEETAVVIAKRPGLHFAISPSEAAFGQEVELRWEVEDADTLTVTDPSGALVYEGPGEDGQTTLVAETSGRYRATASGTGGEESVEAPLAVEPVVESFTALVGGAVRPGALAQVSWSVLGAERIVIDNGAREVLNTTEPQGSEMLAVGPGGNFTLRAYAGSMVRQAHAAAETTEKPVIRSLAGGPLVTAGHGVVGESTIRWEVDGASKIRLEVEPGGLVDLTDKSPRTDEVAVEFVGPGTVTLVATNAAGEVSETIDAPVDPVPTIAEFFATPSRAGSGEAVDLRWAAIDAATVTLLQDGEPQPVDPSETEGSFRTGILGGPSSFELLARNGLGHEVRTTLDVEVGAPNSLSFGTADGMLLYRVGEAVELVWQNDGGASLTVTNQDTGELVCSAGDWADVRQGGCSLQLPEVEADLPLLLEVSNASGTDSQRLDVRAVTGPIILDFMADREEMTEDETIVFSWTVEPDVDGNAPRLELVDDRGVAYPMDDVDPLEGSKRFQIEGWGARSFTLTARAEGHLPYAVSTEVMVYGIPVVDSVAAAPAFAEEEGDSVDVSWATTHGASIELYLLGAEGEAAESPFFTTDDASQVDAGSAAALPTIAQPDVRIVVRNPLGYPTEADLRVGVDPATVDSFTANGVPAPQIVEVLEGETVELAWETVRSTDALLFEAFVDLSQRPGAVNIGTLGTASTSRTILQFPEGFAFPYDGHTFDAVQILNSGVLTFDLTATGSGVNQPLPYTGTSANYRAIDLAPFWDSLRNGDIWWEHIEGEVDQLIIQWTGAEFTLSSYNPTDLNFQVVLFEDGRFEFRYGKMESDHENARGASATIGAQSHDCSDGCAFGEQILDDEEQDHSLEGRVYRFDGLQGFQADGSTPVPVPADGSLTFKPNLSRTYTLRTWNAHSEHEQTLEVLVHPKAAIAAWSDPAEPTPGSGVDLHWETRSLTSLVIEDSSGAVIHTATPEELAAGTLSLGALAQGTHSYTLRGVGMLPHDQITESLEVPVFDPFSLDDFTVSSELIEIGQSVDLSWAATNASSAQIEAFPGGPLSLPDTPNGGTITESPTEMFPV